MERMLLAAPMPTDNGFGPQQQHSSGSSSGSGSSLVEFLTGRSIDLNGVNDVIGALPASTTPSSVAGTTTNNNMGGSANLNNEHDDDVVLGHHTPSYYDQNLAPPPSAIHQQPQASVDLGGMHDDDAALNGAEYAWMKDKKVARKNNHRKFL